MLTGKLVRVFRRGNRLHPQYLDVTNENWIGVAERLLLLFRNLAGCTRAELEADVQEAFGTNPSQLVPQGLAKLLEDRCEFDVDSEVAPEEIREKVFLLAAVAGRAGTLIAARSCRQQRRSWACRWNRSTRDFSPTLRRSNV